MKISLNPIKVVFGSLVETNDTAYFYFDCGCIYAFQQTHRSVISPNDSNVKFCLKHTGKERQRQLDHLTDHFFLA